MEKLAIQDNITYLCTRFAHNFTQALTKEFQKNKLPITAEQFSILVALWSQDGISQNEISRVLDRDKTTITRVLMNLKNNNYITQVVDENDNRSKRVCLTKKGRAIQAKSLEIAGNLYTQIIKEVNENVLLTGIGLMQKLNENLDFIKK